MSPEEVLTTEFSEPFVQGMKDRMVVSFFKYGPVAKAMGVDKIKSLRKRLDLYEATGNTEWLMDVGNFAMIEYMHPGHPRAHFRGTDSRESPGRITVGGDATAEKNADIGRPKHLCQKCESPGESYGDGILRCSSIYCRFQWSPR